MNTKAALLALGSLLLSFTLHAADTIQWDSAKAKITAKGELTVEITVNAHLDKSQGLIGLYLQDKEKPLGDPTEADVTVAKGDRTVTLKRTVTIPKTLTEVDVWTPLYVGSGGKTSIAQVGTLKISWRNAEKPTVTVIMPE